mgnify:CR=1 FL=1
MDSTLLNKDISWLSSLVFEILIFDFISLIIKLTNVSLYIYSFTPVQLNAPGEFGECPGSIIIFIAYIFDIVVNSSIFLDFLSKAALQLNEMIVTNKTVKMVR